VIVGFVLRSFQSSRGCLFYLARDLRREILTGEQPRLGLSSPSVFYVFSHTYLF
jgi:hypothetical protein